MKAVAFALIALSFSSVVHANNQKCRAVKLSFNTHPAVACPDYLAFCTEEVDSGDMSIQARPNVVTNFAFLGEMRQNHSDVGGAIYNYYASDDGMSLEVHFQTNGDYPVVRTGGYTHMTLSTGVTGRSGVYTSQLCQYIID